MDTDKKARHNKKYRARKALSSSESEEDSCTDVILPSAPCPPAKRQRLYDTNEPGSSSSSGDSTKGKNSESQVSDLSSHLCLKDVDNTNITHARNEEAHSSAVYPREEDTPNGENILNWHVDKMQKIDRSSMQDKERPREKTNDNLNYQPSQDAIVDYLKRLTREIATIKYDMKQALTLLDILVKKTNAETEGNKEISFEGADDRFPLQTAEQLMEVEEILKQRDSQHNVAIVS